MNVISLSELRANMAKHFDRVEQDHDELIVTRQNREPMVVMSLSDFRRVERDDVSSRQSGECEDAARFYRRTGCGQGVEHELIEP
ncbi:MAG: type II toxin-antitoxin system Phd/YefM family antitoxin [Pararhizobium sp.]